QRYYTESISPLRVAIITTEKRRVIMPGKNTAVYGIYSSVSETEEELTSCGSKVSVTLTFRCCFWRTRTPSISRTRKTQRLLKEVLPVRDGIGCRSGWRAWVARRDWGTEYPGVGPFIAAGPIVGLLAGVGVGGAVGGLVGAMIGMGMPEYEAKRYEGRIKEGGILLSVHQIVPPPLRMKA